MNRQEKVEQVKYYFSLSDHWRRLVGALQDPDPEGCHIHANVEMSIHPYSLEKVFLKYFDRMGRPSSRKIDHMAPRVGLGSLHGVEPKGMPHFDYQWSYNPDVGLAPMNGGESGCNLLTWNRWYIDNFYKQFDFKPVGSKEVAALREYFKSAHFLQGLTYPVKPDVNHMHINVHSCVHPNHIQKYAEEALAREGWEIYYVCPNVYLADGKNYRGKLVFMCRNPEVVWDIGWLYTPGVIIEPAMEPWVMAKPPVAGYDIWGQHMVDDLLKNDLVELTDAEVDEIVAACKF